MVLWIIRTKESYRHIKYIDHFKTCFFAVIVIILITTIEQQILYHRLEGQRLVCTYSLEK